MRFALALCIVVGCALCGSALARAQKRRVEALRGLIDGIRLMRIHMIRMLEPVNLALKASDFQALIRVGEAMMPGVSARKAWAAVSGEQFRRGGMLDALTASDRVTLDGFFRHLGESGREAQEALLAETLQTLGQALESAARRAGESERLYLSLGVLTGLMLALMVI